jgi:hypothetical protein
MEIFIDNTQADTDAASDVQISLSVSVVTDPRRGRAGYTRTLRLPATPTNDAIFAYADEIHSRDRFNATPHTGRVEHEGCVLIEGPLTLSRAEKNAEGGFYEVHIIGAAREWASAAAKSLATLPVGWSKTLSAATISGSWTGDGLVRFLPVARERTERDYSSGGVIPAMKVLSSDDYHPFIHAGGLLRAIFADAGYRVESEFVDSPAFDDLYVSGNYPTRDVSAAKSAMDFFARRLAAGSATANSQGRVYADPYRSAFSVGNIVDTADPTQSSAAGVSHDDVYANGGCFQMDDRRVAFIPSSAVSVGFQFHLRYTTDYRVKSRTALAGFDTVYLGEQSARSFTLANPWPDRRASFRPARSYRLAVFDHVAGRQYQLRYTQQLTTGGSGTMLSPAMSERFSTVEITGTMAVSDPVLWWRASSSGAWAKYTGDWALYDGFVGETGTLDVELTVRTAPESVTPGAPKFFDTIYFGGADEGMQLTVGEKTWLRPVFYAQPTEGSSLAFADVCAHDASRMDFINSLRQMFGLCFLTDNRERVVRIEPASTLYSGSRVVDWSDRVDLSRPVTVEETGGELAREMVWSYRGGDGATARFNRNNNTQLGRWSATVDNTAAADEVSVWENPMFTPSLCAAGVYLGAPSARLVQAGDISLAGAERTEDLNFVPKIVRYEGMRTLPAGESWGWPLQGAAYPSLAFHSPESGFTLCFEDRDGVTGLHSMWDRDVRLWNSGRRVTVWLALDALDVESLAFPAGSGGAGGAGGAGDAGAASADFHALYRLTIDGEPALYRLEEVCDYTPAAPSTKCGLIKHIP